MPFYAVLAIAVRQAGPLFESPVAVWNPLQLELVELHRGVARRGRRDGLRRPDHRQDARLRGRWPRCCRLLIAYPAAYFVARFAGRRKGLFLILLIAPFWISYMMRMLAWIDLLQTNGYVNKALSLLHLIGQPVNWLGGLGFTVVLGLVYGYIPYLILVLYAGLDRIDPALIEAGRDLGLGRVRTFVTSPCRCPGRRS